MERGKDDPSFSAFVRHSNDSPSIIKIVAGVLLVPMRTLMFFFIALCCCVLIACVRVVFRGKDAIRLSQKVFKLHCKAVLLILGVKVSKPSNLQSAESQFMHPVWVSNHVSYMDIIVFGACFGCPFVAKWGVRGAPIVGSIAKSIGCVFVKRAKGSTGTGAVAALQAYGKGWNSNDGLAPVIVFAEGTTTNGKSILRFRSGAFNASQAVPVFSIKYKYHNFSPAFDSLRMSWHWPLFAMEFSHQADVSFVGISQQQQFSNPEQQVEEARRAALSAQQMVAENLKCDVSVGTWHDKVEYLQRFCGEDKSKAQ